MAIRLNLMDQLFVELLLMEMEQSIVENESLLNEKCCMLEELHAYKEKEVSEQALIDVECQRYMNVIHRANKVKEVEELASSMREYLVSKLLILRLCAATDFTHSEIFRFLIYVVERSNNIPLKNDAAIEFSLTRSDPYFPMAEENFKTCCSFVLTSSSIEPGLPNFSDLERIMFDEIGNMLSIVGTSVALVPSLSSFGIWIGSNSDCTPWRVL